MSALLGVYQRDVTLVRGRGARLQDDQGREYLDFAAGIGVAGLGHADRRVTAAIRRQAGELIHASNLFHTRPASELAERLTEMAFPSRVFLCNSGTEAVEAAIKFARRVGHPAGRSELVAFEGGFHGRTLGALSLTWSQRYREPFEPLVPGVRFCPWNDLGALAAAVGPKTAAVVIEPIQGEGGVRPASPEFLRGVERICRDAGALLVVDEIQCGLGRTGQLFAYLESGIAPDVLTLAKPLGGGLPLGAVLLAEQHAAALQPGDHGSTFGGNPVAAAAALVVLDRLTEPGFLDKVERRGTQLRRGLKRLARSHPERVADVRGRGLMLGVELRGEAKPLLAALARRGVLATSAGADVLRLLPPLVIGAGDVRQFLEALDGALGEYPAP
jgi:predicted acetylornithine/succinylornithine family transaminase